MNTKSERLIRAAVSLQYAALEFEDRTEDVTRIVKAMRTALIEAQAAVKSIEIWARI